MARPSKCNLHWVHVPTTLMKISLILRFYLWLFVFPFAAIIYFVDKLHFKNKSRNMQKQVVGKCKMRGVCCKNIGISLPRKYCMSLFWEKLLWRPYFYWVHNFHHLDTIDKTMIFSCGHLDQNGLCTIYPYRPKLCREFPRSTIHQQSDLHPGCGFSIKD